jgi:hypothetical protein
VYASASRSEPAEQRARGLAVGRRQRVPPLRDAVRREHLVAQLAQAQARAAAGGIGAGGGAAVDLDRVHG